MGPNFFDPKEGPKKWKMAKILTKKGKESYVMRFQLNFSFFLAWTRYFAACLEIPIILLAF